ncbi:ABC transporter substrate-binding protein [uncultured Roseobacter sp.]|uniref:ABC transporter substrate-binding protein n=1 Tax=uncultured Roseobacter sp. TaxID=114847 RepID=UPI00260973E9|nr:ABC transporter substrate-binding protein [uncultured Roseobacter sp.]
MSGARSQMDRRALFASGAAAALLAATGLSAGPAPQRGGRLRMALSGAARDDTFDPRAAQGLFMQVAMAGAAFDTLTEIAADGTLRGELATGWRGNPQADVWTLDLRRDVLFHNGKTLVAEDVAASLALHGQGLLADVIRIETQGTGQLRITLRQGDADFPYRLSTPALVILPGDRLEDAIREGTGTGLYRTAKFLPGRQFIGTRVEDHYKDGTAGWFDSVELVSVPADAVRAQALREGLVDAADLAERALIGTTQDIRLLPDVHAMSAAIQAGVALPAGIGTRWPLDNLRAAERWWMASG